jgi:pimeloyl-ACP methyl ester carboxylesterase
VAHSREVGLACEAHDVIVLLHGSATGSHTWEPVRAFLSSGATVFAPDLLGYCQAPLSCLGQGRIHHGRNAHTDGGTTTIEDTVRAESTKRGAQ